MDPKESLERARDAASAYLERMGFKEVGWTIIPGTDVCITAKDPDGDTFVFVRVSVREGGLTTKKKAPKDTCPPAMRQAVADIAPLICDVYRVDHVQLAVIAQDRALLRHYRGKDLST